ncbi:MAG: helix-turn-helix domain-containing protein [Verrucomicrobiota bacterium]|jgi:DNA-binding NtrC family response regulator
MRNALEVLSAHDWPGNVRELENTIERACALCEAGTIKVADLPPAVRRQAPSDDSEELVEIPDTAPGDTPGLPVSPAGPAESAGHPLSQQFYVNRALALAGGDKEKAAQLLNLSVATLCRKLADEEVAA